MNPIIGWISERFIGDVFTDEEWSNDSNWIKISNDNRFLDIDSIAPINDFYNLSTAIKAIPDNRKKFDYQIITFIEAEKESYELEIRDNASIDGSIKIVLNDIVQSVDFVSGTTKEDIADSISKLSFENFVVEKISSNKIRFTSNLYDRLNVPYVSSYICNIKMTYISLGQFPHRSYYYIINSDEKNYIKTEN